MASYRDLKKKTPTHQTIARYLPLRTWPNDLDPEKYQPRQICPVVGFRAAWLWRLGLLRFPFYSRRGRSFSSQSEPHHEGCGRIEPEPRPAVAQCTTAWPTRSGQKTRRTFCVSTGRSDQQSKGSERGHPSLMIMRLI